MMSILLKFRKEGVNMPNCLTHVFCFVLFLIHSNVSDVNNVYFFGPQTPMCLRISWYAYEKQIVGLHPHGVRRSKWDPGESAFRKRKFQMISDAGVPDIIL